MDISLLKTFMEVNRVRHFGKAAENLFLTQSAVSARINLLEEELGTKLFTRVRNNIQLTLSGQRFLPHAESMINTWSRAGQEISLREDERTLLAISAESGLWDVFLQNWLNNIYLAMPDVSFSIQMYASDALRQKIIDGHIDLALAFEPPRLEELTLREIAKIPMILVASSQALAKLDQMHKNYVYVDWGTAFGVAHAKHFPERNVPKIRIASGRVAVQFLLDQGGLAYLPEPMIGKFLNTGRLHRVAGAPVIERLAYATFLRNTGRLDYINRALSYFSKTSTITPRQARVLIQDSPP